MAVPKRLFFDVETSPNIGFFWQAGFRLKIPYDNIIQERKIICICYKWQGEKEVHSLTWNKKQDDKWMLSKFIKIMNEADEIVGHNGDKFDLTWVRTRCLFHSISVMPKYVTIDTLKQARSKFRFNSNKLNYIAQYLGLGKKIKTDFELWKEVVFEKNQKALDGMVKYCKQDVALLEKVFVKMSNHIDIKTHHGVANEKHKYTCPECGGDHLNINRYWVSPSGYRKVQKECMDCGKYHTIRTL